MREEHGNPCDAGLGLELRTEVKYGSKSATHLKTIRSKATFNGRGLLSIFAFDVGLKVTESP
jgi:hypothetical protein